MPAPADLIILPRRRWLLATRPAFLTLTLGGVLLGLSASAAAQQQHWPLALPALLLALLTHAAVNVINDVADHDNGSDAANTARQFPFTGGSRTIQQGLLSRQQMLWLARGLLLPVVAGGLWLVSQSGVWLLLTGVTGVVLGFGYSAPPLRLNSRGLGEISVLICFTLLPLGMQSLLLGAPDSRLLLASLPYGLLACALLYINQFPDHDADAGAGKRHWVVRLGVKRARYGYPLLLLAAGLILLLAVVTQRLPLAALLPLLLAPSLCRASLTLWHNAARPAALRPAIVRTIVAANLYPLLMALALFPY